MDLRIETQRLVLRRPVRADVPQVAAQIAEWDVIRMLARPPYPYKLQDAYDWFEGLPAKPQNWSFVICPKEAADEKVMGVIGLNVMRDDKPGLGYWLGRDHWGQGFMSEAVEAVVDEAFSAREDIPLIRAYFYVDNPVSGRILEKAGFKRGIQEPFWNPIRGEYVDHIEMILIRTDWEKNR